MPQPCSSGNHSVPVKPNEWKNGSTPMKQSSFVIGKICASPSTLASMLACVSITPFGTPVLPLEKMIVASACVWSRVPRRPPSSARASARASSRPSSLSPRPIVLRRSSRNTIPGRGSIDALRMNCAT